MLQNLRIKGFHVAGTDKLASDGGAAVFLNGSRAGGIARLTVINCTVHSAPIGPTLPCGVLQKRVCVVSSGAQMLLPCGSC